MYIHNYSFITWNYIIINCLFGTFNYFLVQAEYYHDPYDVFLPDINQEILINM